LVLGHTQDAIRINKAPNKDRRAINPDVVHQRALKAVAILDGDPSDRRHVLGQYQLQFGVYYGMTFKWLLENSLGYPPVEE
jgi:hypothetical protein